MNMNVSAILSPPLEIKSVNSSPRLPPKPPCRGDADVRECPSPNHGIKRYDPNTGDDAERSHEPPLRPGTEALVCTDWRKARGPAERDLGDQDGGTNKEDADQVDEHERRAPALPDTRGKTQMLPSPIAEPEAARMNASLEPQNPRSVILSPPKPKVGKTF